jgi:AraC-like DNA-binding protein
MESSRAFSGQPSFCSSSVEHLAGLDVEVPYASATLLVTRWRCREPAHGPSRIKRQPWHAIGFVHAGSFRFRSARGVNVVDPAAFLMLRPEEDYQTAHESCCGDYGSAVALSPETARALTEASLRRGQGDPWARQTRPADPRLLARKLELLRQLASTPAPAGLNRLGAEESLVELVCRVLLPPRPRPTPAAARAASERIHAAQELLERRFKEPLRLDEIASAVETSPFHLCRQFRHSTGWTIHRYLTHLRIAHALERLNDEPRIRLLDLALELGFDGHSHFSAVFRRLVGRSPSAFRGSPTSH